MVICSVMQNAWRSEDHWRFSWRRWLEGIHELSNRMKKKYFGIIYNTRLMPNFRRTITLQNDMSNWNVSKPNKVVASEKEIKIKIPKGGYASKGGINMKFKPDGIKP